MKKTLVVIAALSSLACTSPALAGCSLKDIAGKWVFATDVGRQLGENFPPGKDLTAIGTMNITRKGQLEGVFDITVQDTVFVPNVPYSGTVTLNKDCRGTISFTNAFGASRTDSIVFVNRNTMFGMSTDEFNLFNYQIRRIQKGFRGRDDD